MQATHDNVKRGARECCRTCVHKSLRTGMDRTIQHICVLNPPSILIPVMVKGGQSFAIDQPLVDPDNTSCSHHKVIISG